MNDQYYIMFHLASNIACTHKAMSNAGKLTSVLLVAMHGHDMETLVKSFMVLPLLKVKIFP